MVFFIFLLLVPIYKYWVNIKLHKECLFYRDTFVQWLKDNSSVPDIAQTSPRVIFLFTKAGIKEFNISVTKEVGYGHLQVRDTPVLMQYPSNQSPFSELLYRSFEIAIGEYKMQASNAKDPFYWLDIIIFLPQKTIKLLNLNTSAFYGNFIQLIWWALGCFVTLTLSLYPEIIRAFFEFQFSRTFW